MRFLRWVYRKTRLYRVQNIYYILEIYYVEFKGKRHFRLYGHLKQIQEGRFPKKIEDRKEKTKGRT